MAWEPDTLVIDAHALVWFLAGDDHRLSSKVKQFMIGPHGKLVIPAIALAEACWVVERKKTSIPSIADLLAAVTSDARITIVPLDRRIIEKSHELTTIHEMHDRQIAATTLLIHENGDAALATKDQNITDSHVVPVYW